MGRRWVACLAFALSGCASAWTLAPQSVELTTASVRIPLDIENNLPFVRLRIAGGPALTGLIDTGAGMLVLDPRRVEEARLRSVRRSMIVFGVDGKQERVLPFSLVDRIDLGGVVLSRVLAPAAVELDEVGQAMGKTTDAVVGGIVFGSNLLTIDYAQKTLVIGPGALSAADGVEVLAADFATGVPHVRLDVAGTTVDAIVDSGCSGWLDLPNALESRLPLKKAAVQGLKHMGMNGEGRDRFARLAGTVRIGHHELVDPPIGFTSGQARICAQLLRYFAVTVDVRNRRVRFHRDDMQPIVVEAQRTAGLGLLKQHGSWVVKDLLPGIAPAGVRLDDALVSVNGRAADALTRSDWRELQRGEALQLVIQRGHQTVEVTAPVYEVGTY